jgi:hypothetical protein
MKQVTFRLCAAHPKACLSISIITVLFLSYPAISKFRLPISSPMNVFWNSVGDELDASNCKSLKYHTISSKILASSTPEWLDWSPAMYIQHIIVKGKVDPWFGNLSAVSAVRGSLYESFNLVEVSQNLTI